VDIKLRSLHLYHSVFDGEDGSGTVAATFAFIRGFMNKFCTRLLLILSCALISCASENSNERTVIDLISPESSRQIIAVNDIEWRVLIQINSGNSQYFTFANSALPLSVNAAGVLRGEENNISIKWFEILHKHTVEISEQSQAFFADGSTVIDAPQRHTQFDYDGDGESNLVERSAGTCVWSSTESCVNPGQTDIPTDNVLLNGDFSDGTRYWYSELTEIADTSGEYCVISPVTAEDRFDARIDYLPLPFFIDANSTYEIVFDVRAQTSSEVYIQMTARILDTFKPLVDTSVAVSTTYDTKSIRYESVEEAYSEVSIGFNFGDGTENIYCFDNIKLIREVL